MKVDELTLMVKNANSLYVYWIILPTTIQMVEKWYKTKWTDLAKVLLIFDIKGKDDRGNLANKYFEIPIFNYTDHLFIHKLEPNRTYMAEFGIKLKEGDFFPLLRSNCVRTPFIRPQQTSNLDRYDHNWKTYKLTDDRWLRNFSTYTYYED
jgi:uncharacterized protein